MTKSKILLSETQHDQWLSSALPLQERLTSAAVSILTNLLQRKKVELLSIVGRTKTFDSASEKISRKRYNDPRREMTDLSGIRVITFLESQVAQISKVIRETFDLDEGHSMDRAKLLGADKMGYRSSHFVCMLGGKRAKVPEYSELTELYFEIQVRTVLQHAWAELAHDRSFKFTPGLPPELQRRLNLYAGMLEIVDSGFNSIAIEIDQYAELLRSKPISEILDNVLDSVSIHKFMLDFSKAHKLKIKRGRLSQDVLDELSRYGARNVSDLQRMATDDLVISRRKYQIDDNEVSFLRMMMMFEDIDKYFSAKVSWSVTFRRYVAPLFDKWGEAKVLRLLKERGIRIAEYNLQPYQDEPGEDE